MPCITSSPNIGPIQHHGAMGSLNSLTLTADAESSEGSGAATRGVASSAARENPSSHNGMPAATLLVGYEGIRLSDTPTIADTVDSNGVLPNMSSNTGNVERSSDVEMGEESTADTASEVQADRGPTTMAGPSRSPVLPTEFEGNVAMLKERLRVKGAKKWAVELCDTIFENGVTIGALEERMTREQCDLLNVRDGKQFRLFFEFVGNANGQMTGRHRCGLCTPGKEYKNPRDALRHLLKDHFGLGFKCEQWLVSLMIGELVLTEIRQPSPFFHAAGVKETH